MGARGIFYIFAFASDMERSKRFYKDALGWELGTDEHGVAGFSFGTGYLVLHEDNRPAESRKFAGGLHVEVQVDDAAAERTRLKGLGVAVSELRDEPWGERSFSFADPDGYTWSYGEAR